MTEPTPFTLSTPNGPLHGLVDFPAAPGERPAVVICHGFKGFMEWAFFPYLATLLAERGFVSVRVNLSGSGLLPGEDRVSDPAAFRRNTHSRDMEHPPRPPPREHVFQSKEAAPPAPAPLPLLEE